jgi:hypothetical protein
MEISYQLHKEELFLSILLEITQEEVAQLYPLRLEYILKLLTHIRDLTQRWEACISTCKKWELTLIQIPQGLFSLHTTTLTRIIYDLIFLM